MKANSMPKKSLLLFFSAFVIMAPIASLAQEAGLAERRAMAAYSKDVWPSIEKSIQEAAGFPVAVSLDLGRLALPGYADSYKSDDYLRKPIIDPLLKSLAAISQDEMGKEALQSKLKKIVITYDEATAPASNYENGVVFESGNLTINWKPFTNIDDLESRSKAVTKVLESNL